MRPLAIDPLVGRLAAVDCCAVSDALDRAGVSGVLLGLSQLSMSRRIAGRAITVTLGPDDGRKAGRHLGTAAVEAGRPETIIVVAHQRRIDVAGWGGILSLGAKAAGVEGVVIDGACRDVDEARELELPIYGRCGVPRTARGRIIEVAWDVPVDVCGVAVSPGDYLIADASGVAAIPAQIAESVIVIAEMIVRKERRMADAIRAGEPISKVMGASYEEMLKDGPAS